MTHADLVNHARRWLQRHHAVVITEMVSSASETPDAIGFNCGYTTVVECKATRSDFLSDKRKFFRRCPFAGVGNYRLYLAPKGLIDKDELPLDWGLVEVSPKGWLRTCKKAVFQNEKSVQTENSILISAFRRVGQSIQEEQCVSVRPYTHQTKRTATLSVECA